MEDGCRIRTANGIPTEPLSFPQRLAKILAAARRAAETSTRDTARRFVFQRAAPSGPIELAAGEFNLPQILTGNASVGPSSRICQSKSRHKETLLALAEVGPNGAFQGIHYSFTHPSHGTCNVAGSGEGPRALVSTNNCGRQRKARFLRELRCGRHFCVSFEILPVAHNTLTSGG
jgi:hypothetical protein